jgi:hypothetical protein
VKCSFTHIPDLQELQDCADDWAEDTQSKYYPEYGGIHVQQKVAVADRGAFFIGGKVV